MDQLWDRGDPVGYVEGLGAHPLPDTPTHSVLMQIAYGDHQVSMYAGAAEARSIGADAYEPRGTSASALTAGGGRNANANLFYGLKPVPLSGYTGSAIEVWDSGPGHTLNPPIGNIAPADTATNIDPHGDPRATPAAQQQISDFLEPNGTFVNVCGGSALPQLGLHAVGVSSPWLPPSARAAVQRDAAEQNPVTTLRVAEPPTDSIWVCGSPSSRRIRGHIPGA